MAKSLHVFVALTDSGYLMGRGKNSKKGTYCLWWGTRVQKAVGHFTTFCPMERQPRGCSTTFCALEGQLREHLTVILHWKRNNMFA